MTANEYINDLMNHPLVRALQLQEPEKKEALRSVLPDSINRITSRYLFDFMEDTDSVSSIKDENTYELPGNADDARSVITVMWGSDKTILQYLSPTAVEVKYSNVTIGTSIVNWTKMGKVNQHPRIILYGTPTAAGTDIWYRYARKNIPIEEFPDEWAYVVKRSCIDLLFANMDRFYEKAIREMIDHHRANPVEGVHAPLDRDFVRRNRERSNMHGF